MSQAVTVLEKHNQQLLNEINQKLAEWKKNGAHVVAPITLQVIPALHRPVVDIVYIDPDPTKKEVYKRGDGLAISGIGWKKLATGMGIQKDHERSRRLDDGSDPNRCHYQVVAWIKSQDGTMRQLSDTKQILMDDLVQELTDNYREKASKYLDDPKDGPAFRKAYPDPEVWITEKVRQDALQIKKHIVARCETGAFNRMVKSIGIRETYTPAELQKPFVFLKLVADLDPNHPMDRSRIIDQAIGSISQLYPAPSRTQELQPPRLALPSDHTDAFPEHAVIDHRQGWQIGQDQSPASPSTREIVSSGDPTQDELQRITFTNASPQEQAQMLQELIRKKNYNGKVQGELAKWTAQQRQSFFDKLVSMADAVTGKPELPFE